MKLSKNFSTEEWVCKCGCGQLKINGELVDMMQKFRDRIGKPVVVHCVNRCPDHNAEVGGVQDSKHVDGKGCDFHVRGMSMKELHATALSSEDILTGGIGLYDWGVHADVGPKRTWDKRSG